MMRDMPASTAPLSSSAIHHQRSFWVVVVAIFLFVGFFGASNWYRQINLVTSQYDMGNMDQVLWHTLHGHAFSESSPVYARQESRLAVHADFLLLAYLPFYAVWPDPRVMLVGQVLAVASGALAVYFIARRRLSGRWGALFAVLYLCYPPLLWATTFDVHAVVLATPILLWAWLAMEKKQWGWFWILMIAALFSKEELGLTAGFLGLWMMMKHDTRRRGAILAIIGFAWTFFLIGWAIPQARQAPGHFALGYFSSYGDTPGKITTTIVTKPANVISDLFTDGLVPYAHLLLGPLGFASLLAWPVLIIALPEITINVISSSQNLQTIFYHYTSAITPIVFLSSILGIAWILRKLSTRSSPLWRRRGSVLIAAWLCLWSAAYIWWWAPLPGMRHHTDAMVVFYASPYRADIAAIQKLLRPEDKVASTNNVAPQFTRRMWAWSFPLHLDQATVVVALRGGNFEAAAAPEIDTQIQRLTNDPAWQEIYHRQDMYAFRRLAP